MKLIINPYVGVGPITLGMKRKDVTKVLNNKIMEFMKTRYDETITDDIIGKGIHVYYKKTEDPGNDICEAVEMGEPACPIFNNKKLISQPFNEILDFFKQLDNDIKTDETGMTSFKYGIGIYAPYAYDKPSELTQGVIVFEKGYYDFT